MYKWLTDMGQQRPTYRISANFSFCC